MKKQVRSRESGIAMVEFAIGVSLLVTCFAGVFSYGLALYRYDALVSAVTTGARYASLAHWDSVTQSASTAFETKVKNIVVYGDPAGGTTPRFPGLTTSNVVLTPVTQIFGTSTVYTPTYMQVSISNLTIPAIFKNITFNGKPKVRFPFEGMLTPVAGGN
jgi:Flp pilus assembly protein TadG